MIINIAGTSGSGKTHLVRGFMDWAGQAGVLKPLYVEGRKVPIGYDLVLPHCKTIHVVGSYADADTAGCDTIRDVEFVYGYVREQAQSKHVLYEGLFMMNHTRGPQLIDAADNFVVFQLEVSLSGCIASINVRRKARGEPPLVNTKNTEGNFVRANNYCGVMRGAGAKVIRVKREEALGRLCGLFGFEAPIVD